MPSVDILLREIEELREENYTLRHTLSQYEKPIENVTLDDLPPLILEQAS